MFFNKRKKIGCRSSSQPTHWKLRSALRSCGLSEGWNTQTLEMTSSGAERDAIHDKQYAANSPSTLKDAELVTSDGRPQALVNSSNTRAQYLVTRFRLPEHEVSEAIGLVSCPYLSIYLSVSRFPTKSWLTDVEDARVMQRGGERSSECWTIFGHQIEPHPQ